MGITIVFTPICTLSKIGQLQLGVFDGRLVFVNSNVFFDILQGRVMNIAYVVGLTHNIGQGNDSVAK